MKIKFIQNNNNNDISVTIEANESSVEAKKIIEYLNNYNSDNYLMVDNDMEKIKLFYNEIICFFTEKNIIYVKTDKNKYRIKSRIYELESVLPEDTFVKINQGVIANIKKIKKVSPCINGTMRIEFLNNDIEYASRRSVKSIKEKLGL